MKSNIILSNRLEVASSLVDTSPCIDVGSDHGLLALFLENKGYKVYASENKIGPYNRLVNNLKENFSSITPLFIDGILKMPDDIKCIIILGMGGDTIYKILSEGRNRLNQIESIIIEPQSNFKMPISFLYENGFKNIDSKLIYEKHYYPILKYVKGQDKIDDKFKYIALNYGFDLVRKRDSQLRVYLEIELEKLNNIEKLYELDSEKKNKKNEILNFLNSW